MTLALESPPNKPLERPLERPGGRAARGRRASVVASRSTVVRSCAGDRPALGLADSGRDYHGFMVACDRWPPLADGFLQIVEPLDHDFEPTDASTQDG